MQTRLAGIVGVHTGLAQVVLGLNRAVGQPNLGTGYCPELVVGRDV